MSWHAQARADLPPVGQSAGLFDMPAAVTYNQRGHP